MLVQLSARPVNAIRRVAVTLVLFVFVWFFAIGLAAAVVGPLRFCMATYGLASPTICTSLDLH